MMLSSSQVTNSNNQPTLKNSTTCQISSTNVSKSPSNLQNMKCESFVAASPAIEDDISKLQESGAEQNTKLRECEVPSSLSMHVQKTNKYLNSSRAEMSPKNASDSSNSSNIALKNNNKNEKLTKELIEDLNIEKTSNAKRTTASSKEDETDKSLSEKSSNGITVKDEEDILNGIGTIKKEENISPQLSPGGFDISDSGNTTENLNHVKCNLGTPKNALQLNQKDRLINSLNTDESTSCNINSNQINEPNNTQYLPSNNNANFMQDFMQQQNHIFVFSTQLANKGAESVLNGHFPTIIAYHCMQPTTKSFLEDFFSKNPMKVTKLQRQTSLNFSTTNNQGNAHWLNSCNTKISQKNCSNKANIGNVNSSLENNKSTVPFSVRGGASNAFPETPDVLSNENDFFSWDQIRNNLEGETLKILEGVGTGLKSQQSSNKSIGFMESNENNIPSLQGVKVPDENLTPQQRQHREEQLAKLKKMNQFLFPENGSDFKIDCASVLGSNTQMNKLPSENVSNILMCPQMNAQMNQTVQNSTPNVLNQSQQMNCNTENIAALSEEQAISSEVMTNQESGIQCNINKSVCSSNGTRNNVQRTTCSSNAIMVGSNGNVNSTADIINEFNSNNIPATKNSTSIQRGEDNHSNISQLEWSKPQQHFYDERLKNKQIGEIANSISSANSTINNTVRCSSHNNTNNSTNINATNSARTIQGPPPPYHSTQRSASVPIAQSQSPNPSSPTNPTSNLSLPSPHTSAGTGMRENSPGIDTHTSLQSSSAGTIATISTNPCNQSKTNFHSEGSPSHANRNRSGFSQLNSNPSTPLSHMSPKDVESFSASGAQDLKNARPSPQTPRSPTMSTNQNNVDQYNTDGRFNSGSPGLNFCPPLHGINTSNSSYKSPGSMERHNSVALASQFCRRSENLPLNPNSSRAPPSKLNTSFDPISSLAQMSQQLTSCTSHNPHIGQSTTGIGLGGMSDMPLISSVNQNLENIIHPSEGNIDHCGTNANAMSGIPPHVAPGGPYAGNNCHQMMGPIGQRMVNPKLCGNFHPGSANLRDGQGNIHPLGPGPRMVGGRMQMNFNNFNVSPNIQVKASTPNTIQYMPVRPQNNNNNLRPPPSLEFLQRYANPQISMGVNIIDGGQILQSNAGLNNDQNKMTGNVSNQGINYFQTCNQTGMMGLDQDDLSQNVPGTDINLGAPIIRGGRPVRQHSLPSRMQNINTGNQQFSSGSQDPLECSADPANIYNNVGENVIGQSQIFSNNQQKGPKGICQSMSSSSSNNNSSMTNSGSMPNEHNVNLHSGLGSSTMMGSNTSGGNVPPGSSINSNGNYKYLGPTPNDIKYAQQYHSFQQQLYATSTRNQHGPTTNGIGTNPSTNPTFFVNK